MKWLIGLILVVNVGCMPRVTEVYQGASDDRVIACLNKYSYMTLTDGVKNQLYYCVVGR